jgi:glyoxylase-like metal-dependent hydrolase (beta-lactamase superfamily II)
MKAYNFLINKVIQNAKRNVFSFVFICMLISSGNSITAQTFESKHFRLEKISGGVYAAIHINGGYAICNAGIINLGEKTLIFDPFITPEAARDLRTAAETLFKNPIAYVVNSHFHNDHIRGSQVFPPGASFISTTTTRDYIAANEPQSIEAEKEYAPEQLAQLKEELQAEKDSVKRKELIGWVGYFEALTTSNSELKTTLADITFDSKLTLIGAERKVELIEFNNGHTASDIILYLPEEKIIFMGDILFINNHPWLADGNPENLITTLKNIQQMDADVFVSGHGSVGSNDDIATMIGYIENIKLTAINLLKEGKSREEINELQIPEIYNGWFLSNFYKINVKFMYEHLQEKD